LNELTILCIGDVVGKAGRGVLADHLAAFIKQRQIDLVICNAENAAGGSGLTPQIYQKLLRYGVDVITLGDHAHRKKEIIPTLEQSKQIVRPANLAMVAAGKQWTTVSTKGGQALVGVACVLGQMYMRACDSPWDAVDRVLKEMPSEARIRVIDFHAEASSEKIAMGYHLDGRVSAVFGTHTHVPTADARILPGGTAVVTDVGMTGPYDSVLGRRKDRVLKSLITTMPTFYEVATGDPRMAAVMIKVDPMTGKASAIERVEVTGTAPANGPYDSDDGAPSGN
jgi:hypothetical protein